jgi:hypothetical protein
MNRLVRFACLASAAFLSLPRPAAAEAGPRFRDERSQALGHTGVASSSGATSLFLNPAALGRAQGGHFGFSGNLGMNGVLLEYAKWAKDNYRYLDNTDSMLARIGPVDNKWAPFTNTLYLHGSWGDIGLAAALDTRYDLTVAKAVVTPVIGVGALSDFILTAGRGFEVGEGYRFGFALKYLYRLRYDDRLVGTTDEDFYTAKQAWEKESHGWLDDISKLQVAGDIAETSQGVGANFGLEKDLSKSWTAGMSLLDFPTVLDQRLTRADIDLGITWHPAIDWLPDIDDRIIVNLDWQRMLFPGTPWFKQVKAGAAFEGWMRGRPVSYIGLGLNDGYPTFGLRFGYLVYLSYVYTAEEIGTYPGQQKLSFHKIVVQAEY